IRIADPEVDQVLALLAQLSSLAVDIGEQVRRQLANPTSNFDLHEAISSTTGFSSVPIPSISISIRSPGEIGATPEGVPVETMSPGSIVITREARAISSRTGKMRSLVDESCRTTPFCRVRKRKAVGSRPVAMLGPAGQKVSKPLARVNCPSFFCRSR